MNENSVPTAPPAASEAEQLSVKISYGTEIRRVTLPNTSYGSMLEHTSSLFGLPQADIVLKYEDDDGDKISMSSDMELQEALRLSKATQKILRLFVELKAAPQTSESPATKSRGVSLMPQGPKFGGPKPMHAHPFSPHAGFPHPPHPHPHMHPHPPPPGYSPEFHHPPAPGFGSPSVAYHVHQAPPQPSPTNATPAVPPGYGQPTMGGGMERGWGGRSCGPDYRHQYRRPHNNVYFGQQTAYTTHNSAGSWGDNSGFDRNAHKEARRAMREQWKEIKADMKKGGQTTEEDKRKFRELKEEMKSDMKYAKKDAMLGMKAMKLNDKKQRLVARHVADVTIPDGTELPANTPFIKTWRIRNEGPAWPIGSQLLFVSHKGDNLNGPERVVVKGEVLPGQEVEVSVPLITPSEPGRYVGYYRMVTPDNIKFGQRVWVSFVVNPSMAGTNNYSNISTTNNVVNSIPVELSKVCDTMDQ